MQAWISRNKLKSKLRLKSEILLKFEKSPKKAFLEKNLAQILTQLEKKLVTSPPNLSQRIRSAFYVIFFLTHTHHYIPPTFSNNNSVFPVTSREKNHWFAVAYSDMFILGR